MEIKIKLQKLFTDLKYFRLKVKTTENQIKKLSWRDWWHPTMCHNFDECGDACHDCDLPKEMWEDIKKEYETLFG